MKRSTGNWIALAVFTGVAVYLTWLIIAPFVDVLIWATVLAVVSYPVFLRWRARGWGKASSSLLTTMFVVLVIVIPLSLVGMMLLRQLPQAAAVLQETAHKIIDPDSKVFQWLGRWIDLEPLRDRNWINEKAQAISAAVASRSLGIVGGVLGALVQILLVLFTLFYLLKDAERIVPAIRDAMPLDRSQADEVIRRTHEIISASLQGVLVIAAIQGALGGLAFWALGIQSPVLWGVVMFLLSMIPMGGAAIVWAPVAIYLASTGSVTKAVILTVWGAGVIGMIDNLLRPKLVGERTRLHELIVFFSVLGGLQVFGVLGLVVGPVVFAITMSLIEVFRRMDRGPEVVVVPAAAAGDPALRPIAVESISAPEAGVIRSPGGADSVVAGGVHLAGDHESKPPTAE
jgi:predicted PurR-regulated permease PerM